LHWTLSAGAPKVLLPIVFKGARTMEPTPRAAKLIGSPDDREFARITTTSELKEERGAASHRKPAMAWEPAVCDA
jgi:hypothetical protein